MTTPVTPEILKGASALRLTVVPSELDYRVSSVMNMSQSNVRSEQHLHM